MTAEDQENMPRWWSPSIDTLLQVLGQVIASISVMVMILGMVLLRDGADEAKFRALSMLIGGAYGLVSGLVMWGLAAVIEELMRIRIALEDRYEGRP